MKFSYPVEDIDSLEFFCKEHEKWAIGGYFPIGNSHTWHGGIHIETKKPVLCIADGTIVAYLFSTNYKEYKKGDDNILFSNNFVLVQHHYKSQKEQEFVFYSLYQHLRPQDDSLTEKLPPFLSKTDYKTGSGIQKKKGLEMWLNINAKKEFVLLPKGSIFTVKSDKNEEKAFVIANSNYRSVLYKKNGEEIEGYIYFLNTYELKDNEYRIKYSSDERDCEGVEFWRNNNKDAILDLLPKDTILKNVVIEGSMAKVTLADGRTGYIENKKENIIKCVVWDSDAVSEDVKNCNISVKGGEILGYGGYSGINGTKNPTIVHLEIFTADKENLESFIHNKKKDGIEGDKVSNPHTILPKELKKSFICKLLGDTEITVFRENENYYLIKIGSVKRTVDRSKLGDFKGWNNPGYSAKKDSDIFESLPQEGDFIKLLETQKEIDAKREKKDTSCNVEYSYPNITGKTFWIEKKYIDKMETEISDNPMEKFLDPWISQNKPQQSVLSLSSFKKRKVTLYRLHSDFVFTSASVVEQELYLYDPLLFKSTNLELEDSDRMVVKLKNENKITPIKDKNWYYVSAIQHNEKGNQLIVGYFQPEDFFPPQNWDKFGFEISEADKDTYLMDFQNLSPLLQKIWNIIDEDGDKELTDNEFRRAVTNYYHAFKISRHILYHRSEWAYTDDDGIDDLEKELKDAFDKCIQKMAKNAASKDILEKERDKKVKEITDLAKELNFWNKIKIDTSPQESKQTLKTFPKEPYVYHFHPIAFVEQMMRKCFCGKEHIDLRDKVTWISQFNNIFGTSEKQKTACCHASNVILTNAGLKTTSYATPKFQTAKENDVQLIIDTAQSQLGINYLNEELEKGHPILVGVDHTYKYKGGINDDKTTDHFVVIVGRGCEEDKAFYYFYEVGTGDKSKGESDNNKLYIQDDYSLKGTTAYNTSKKYTVTVIRKNI